MTTIINAQNNQAQDLFVTSFPSPRVPSLTSVGTEAVLTFDTTNVNLTTSASLNGATGQITLSSTSTVYQITAQAEFNSNTPVHLKLVESATGNQVGVAVPINMPLNVVVQPASAGDYEIVIYSDQVINFQYPNQVQRAQLTIEALDGSGAGNPFDQSLNTTDSVEFANITVTGTISATVMTVEHTTVTTTIVETDDIIRTTNATQAGAGVGAIVATAGGISAGLGFYTANTSTFGYATLGPNNSAVAPVNVAPDAENMLYLNNNIGGSLIFRQRQNSTTYRNFTITRTGNLIMDSGANISNGLAGAGDIYIGSYYNTSTSVSGTVGMNSYFSEGSVSVGPSGVILGTYGDAKTITLQCGTDAGTIQAATVSTTTFDISVPVVINNTATTSTLYNAQVSFDTTNPPVPGFASLSSYPGATKFASTLSGAGITIETFRTSTGFQKWHFSRSGSLVFPGGSSYFSSSLGSSLTGPSNAPVSLSDGNVQSLIELTTSTGIKLWTDWQTAAVPTIDVQTSAVSVNAPLSATTATITYINVGPVAQLRSQSSNFPFGLNTATILTVDSAVYNSGRLHVSVGGTLGLGSEAEHIQIDFITNGVTVVSTTSNLLTTTSPSLCSYAVSMTGTDVIVEATNLDPGNFFPTEVNVMAELVANSIS